MITLNLRNHRGKVGARGADQDTKFGIYPVVAYDPLEFLRPRLNNKVLFPRNMIFFLWIL